MSANERSILLQFKNGAQITSEEEYSILEKASATGLVKFGMNMDGDNLVAEAKLTSRGKWFLKA